MSNRIAVYLLAVVAICHAQVQTAGQVGSGNANPLQASSVHDFTALAIDGKTQVNLGSDEFKGHPLLIVNTATFCVQTLPTYTMLKNLVNTFYERGLRVLLFPCNQFLWQEPRSNEKIAEFARGYSDKFNLFAKSDVNGANANPLYQYLKQQQPGALGKVTGGAIEWNFAKFLVDKDGKVVKRWAPFIPVFDSEIEPYL